MFNKLFKKKKATKQSTNTTDPQDSVTLKFHKSLSNSHNGSVIDQSEFPKSKFHEDSKTNSILEIKAPNDNAYITPRLKENSNTGMDYLKIEYMQGQPNINEAQGDLDRSPLGEVTPNKYTESYARANTTEQKKRTVNTLPNEDQDKNEKVESVRRSLTQVESPGDADADVDFDNIQENIQIELPGKDTLHIPKRLFLAVKDDVSSTNKGESQVVTLDPYLSNTASPDQERFGLERPSTTSNPSGKKARRDHRFASGIKTRIAADDEFEQKKESRRELYIKIAKIAGAFIFYFMILPIILLFGAFNYDSQRLKAFLNNSILGFYLGATQIALLYQMIDLPILLKVHEMEGKHSGLIKAREYMVLTKKMIIYILVTSTGFQCAIGQVVTSLDVDFAPWLIVISCWINILLNAGIYFAMLLFRSGHNAAKEQALHLKKINKEFKAIEQIRRIFVTDIVDTRKELDVLQQMKAGPGDPGQMNIKLGVDATIDIRRFNSKKYDFSSEASKISGKSVKSFFILGTFLTQLLVLVYMVKAMHELENGAAAVTLACLFPLVGFIYGIVDPDRKLLEARLNLFKAISIIAVSAVYRFIYFQVGSQQRAGAIFAAKFVFKIIFYLCGFKYYDRIMKYLNKKKDIPADNILDPAAAEDHYFAGHLRYLFQKFVFLHACDLYYDLSTLMIYTAAQDWFKGVSFDLILSGGYDGLYKGLSVLEFFLDIGVLVLGSYIVQKLLRKRSGYEKFSAIEEIKTVLEERKWLTLAFQTGALFILILMFLNGL